MSLQHETAGKPFLGCGKQKSQRGAGGKALQNLIVLGGDVGHHIGNIAIQDPAQVVDGGDVNGLVFAELIDGGAGNAMVFDQRIGGLLRVPQRLPKRCIRNHGATFLHAFSCII